MKTAILILAAGKSSRMGRPKQLLPIKHKTLLNSAIDTALASNCSDVICVIGAYRYKIKASIPSNSVKLLENSNFEHGLSTSIIEGVNYLEKTNCEGLLIMLADQPKISTSHLNQLLSSFENHPSQISATAYPNSLGVPAVFPKRFFEGLKQLKGDKGAKDFLNSRYHQIVQIKHSQLFDIDTIQDYEDYLKSL
ncbi:nucleotidyltransferase family protein [Winogradskyella aurantia]|uniref:MobA-like NTP transferase domain-containing protein n=1 Tax=Winogradskyella aurantia TaxID=1915063 RepID=A0A265UZJ8_9FLAO|nr:nucleotidyltransferase family protein [Winogradskyella aurantia]OZV70721.1 hypothetical protein CA834_01000 [Winogradskyella aurantia]